jgi:putative ABC transport system permease protein
MWFVTMPFRNLWQRKIRTALTCLGMAVAVCAVVTMIGVAEIFEEGVTKLLETRGVDLVVTRGGVAQRVVSTLDAGLRARFGQLPGVKGVEPFLIDVVSLEESNLVAVYVIGWDIDGHMFDDLHYKSGRGPHAGDKRPAVLGASMADALGKRVGDRVTIEDEEFNVVGIQESPHIVENSTIVVSITDLQDLMDRTDQVTGFLIVVEESAAKQATIEAVRQQILDLKDEDGRKIGVSALPTDAHVHSALEFQVVRAMAWTTSAIAMVIGVIGMLNTMMIAVFERTQEIGTLRAIGWPKARVVRLILLESLILSSLGWAVGIVGSLVLTRLLSIAPTSSALILPSAVSPAILSQAFLLAIVAGIIGAAYPAFVAARLVPTVALRHE